MADAASRAQRRPPAPARRWHRSRRATSRWRWRSTAACADSPSEVSNPERFSRLSASWACPPWVHALVEREVTLEQPARLVDPAVGLAAASVPTQRLRDQRQHVGRQCVDVERRRGHRLPRARRERPVVLVLCGKPDLHPGSDRLGVRGPRTAVVQRAVLGKLRTQLEICVAATGDPYERFPHRAERPHPACHDQPGGGLVVPPGQQATTTWLLHRLHDCARDLRIGHDSFCEGWKVGTVAARPTHAARGPAPDCADCADPRGRPARHRPRPGRNSAAIAEFEVLAP